MKRSIIQTKNLGTGFKLSGGNVLKLHQTLDLRLEQNELVCVLGQNGSGKSTLLKTLIGFIKPLEGNIFLNDKPLNLISAAELAKFVSVVLTDKIDDFYLTAFEIALTGRYPHGSFFGKISKDDKRIVENIFDQLSIGHLINSTFFKLSDGEKQRVMIARAIAQDTPFIFMDEPVAFIDSPGKVDIMQLIKSLTEELNKGVLMATHDIDSAIDNADRFWLLGKEGTFEQGKPEELISNGSIGRFFDQQNIMFDKNLKKFVWKG